MNTFTVNHKRYTAKAFDFNLVCDLDDAGYSLADISKKPLSIIRVYFALCADLDKEEAGKEIEAHMRDGGSLSVIQNAMSKEMSASDFFQTLNKRAETENQSSEE